MTSRLTEVGDEVFALGGVKRGETEADEPYRQALRAIRARLAATAGGLFGDRFVAVNDGGYPKDGAATYADATEFLADLDVIDESLRSNGDDELADDRLLTLREAVRAFGFHLSGLDMRQNSEIHEEVVAELLRLGGRPLRLLSLPTRPSAWGC